MPTPWDAPYKMLQRALRPAKHTKWTLADRIKMADAHRMQLKLRAVKQGLGLPRGSWWPALAPLTPRERAIVRYGKV